MSSQSRAEVLLQRKAALLEDYISLLKCLNKALSACGFQPRVFYLYQRKQKELIRKITGVSESLRNFHAPEALPPARRCRELEEAAHAALEEAKRLTRERMIRINSERADARRYKGTNRLFSEKGKSRELDIKL